MYRVDICCNVNDFTGILVCNSPVLYIKHKLANKDEFRFGAHTSYLKPRYKKRIMCENGSLRASEDIEYIRYGFKNGFKIIIFLNLVYALNKNGCWQLYGELNTI